LGSGVIDVRVAPSAADPATVYARMRLGSDHQVYATNDSGASWELRSTLSEYTALIATDATDESRVYVAGVHFYRSDDGGRTWGPKPGAHDDYHAVMGDPAAPGAIYTACDGGLYRSDRGDAWEFRGLRSGRFRDAAGIGDRRQSGQRNSPDRRFGRGVEADRGRRRRDRGD
jgi:photosystem II stability/assembly factor-like uncharacterized protein